MSDAARNGTAFAKTTQPTIGPVVGREDLFARLDQPEGRSAIFIGGPPGSGKTTLVASYLAARSLRSLWYQVDAGDADPAGFFHYLRHAARRLEGLRAGDLPTFGLQDHEDIGAFARSFFRALFAKSRGNFAVVLDNLQAVAPDSALHVALASAIEQVPKGCCIVLASRAEPPAYLARLRATRRVAVIAGADLAMGPDVIRAVATLRGQPIAPEVAAKLFEMTRGWVAGLVLLLEHARFAGRLADLPEGAAPAVIFDYLAGEIFDRFDRPTREFLLRIACLPRTTEAIAEKLSGEPAAARVLINLAANDYFVRCAAIEGRRVYELHPLLRDFLRSRAAQVLPEAATPAWLQRAAALLRDAGDAPEAAALLIEAKDWDGVAAIIRDSADAMLSHGRGELLRTWLDALPEGAVDADPRLALFAASASAHADPRSARRRYEHAFEGFRAVGDVRGMLQCCAGALDGVLMAFDDYAELDRWTHRFETVAFGGPAPGAPVPDIAVAAPWVRALLVRDPGNASLREWLEGAAGADRRSGTTAPPRSARASDAILRAMVDLAAGDVVAGSTRLAGVATVTARRASGSSPALAIASGLLHLMGGRAREAERAAQAGLDAAEAEGRHAFDARLRCIVAAARLQVGNRAGASEVLQHTVASGMRLRRGDRACVHYLRGWLAAIEGDGVIAHNEAKAALAVAREVGMPWLEGLAGLALAQVLAASRDRGAAEDLIRDARGIAARLGSPWLDCGAALAEAGAAHAARDASAVAAGLHSAFRAAREHGFLPPPQWQPQVLADLCERALADGIEAELARTVVRSVHVAPRVPPLRVRRWPWPIRIVTLGGFRLARDDVPVTFPAKGPGRPIELLKVLVALGGRDVRVEQLADALWPQAEADFAYQSFTATLHRLRRTLQADDALVLNDGRLSLDRSAVWVDVWALEQALEALEAELRGCAPGGEEGVLRGFVDELRELYRGAFLPDEAEQLAYVAYREHVRSRMLRAVTRVVQRADERGVAPAAIDCCACLTEADELFEPFHRLLMQALQRNGEVAAALAAYERLRTALVARNRAMPSTETQALYANLKLGAAGR